MTSSTQTFGKGDIKSWLREINETQTWLAEQLGKSRQYINKLCKGSPASPDVAYAIEELSGGRVQARELVLRGRDPLTAAPGDESIKTQARVAAPMRPQHTEEEIEDLFGLPEGSHERISIRLPADKVERLRRIVWYSEGTTITGLIERGLDLVLQVFEGAPAYLVNPNTREMLKKPAGEPYPPREGPVRVGRPMSPD